MVKPILTQADEFGSLHEPCVDVIRFDEELRSLVADMWDTMYYARGVGLASTQIGSRLRVAVVDTIQRASSNRRLVMVNPRILEHHGEQTDREGCLSMPGMHWPITRSEVVKVEFQDLSGKKSSMTVRGLLSRCVQHECDHLAGVLCNSRADQQQIVVG